MDENRAIFYIGTEVDPATGQTDFDIAPERIAQLKASADFVIFTPGSTAGIPVPVLQSFRRSLAVETKLLRPKASNIVVKRVGVVFR